MTPKTALALLALLGLLGGDVAAQQKPAAGPASCLISGRLINVTTGQPVPHVPIYIMTPAAPDSPQTSRGVGAATDAAGFFETKPLQPGRYLVQRWHYDSRRHSYVRSSIYGREAVLTLRPGQKLTGLKFEQESPGEIDGHVVDENGKPVAHAVVTASRVAHFYEGSGMYLAPGGGSAMTDAQGEYRITRVAPGRYVILMWRSGGIQRSGTAPLVLPDSYLHYSTQRAVRMYYPSGSLLADAKQVAVAAGKKTTGIDFRFPHTPVFSVSGRATSSIRGGGPYVTVVFMLPSGAKPGNNLQLASTLLQPGGPFRLVNIGSGSYVIFAVQFVRNRPEVSSFPFSLDSPQVATAITTVEVKGKNVEGVNLELKPPVTGGLTGRIAVDGKAPVPLERLSLYLIQSGPYKNDSTSSYIRVKPDGSFAVPALAAGRYGIRLVQPIGGAYLESVRWGGRDAFAHPFHFEPKASSETLDVVVSFSPARLTGTVIGPDGRPIQGATVLVVPAAPLPDVRELYKSVVTDQNGNFVMPEIRPGTYEVYAWQNINNDAWLASGFKEAARGRGVAIELGKSEEKALYLRAIPAAETAALRP